MNKIMAIACALILTLAMSVVQVTNAGTKAPTCSKQATKAGITDKKKVAEFVSKCKDKKMSCSKKAKKAGVKDKKKSAEFMEKCKKEKNGMKKMSKKTGKPTK